MFEVPKLIDDLLEGNRLQRDQAANRLRGMAFDLHRLVPVLEHPHVSRQIKAIEVIRWYKTREAFDLLLPFLSSDNDLIAKKAVSGLGRVAEKFQETLVPLIENAPTNEIRLRVLDVLSRFQHPRAREVLLVQADAWEPAERARALEYLRRYRADPAIDTIVAQLHDPETRETSIEVAGRLQHEQFLPILLAIWLDDPSPPREAMYAIAKYGDRGLDALLSRAAKAPRARIADAIEACLANGEVQRRFWTLWQRHEAAIRDACLAHLGQGYARQLSTDRRISALEAHVTDPEATRRRACIRGLSILGQTAEDAVVNRALEALRRIMADDPDEDVRRQATVEHKVLMRVPRG